MAFHFVVHGKCNVRLVTLDGGYLPRRDEFLDCIAGRDRIDGKISEAGFHLAGEGFVYAHFLVADDEISTKAFVFINGRLAIAHG